MKPTNMEFNYKVDLMPTAEVAKLLKTTPPKVIAMMLNGTLPIGGAVRAENPNEKNGAYIIRRRFEAFVEGKDLGL